MVAELGPAWAVGSGGNRSVVGPAIINGAKILDFRHELENMSEERTDAEGWREKAHEIIFEADTPAGKAFDVLLLILIVLSVAAVLLESMQGVRERYGTILRVAEWVFTLLFTVEYVVRLASVRRPLSYATSFFGVVDLLSVLPSYLSLFFTGTHALVVIRALRLLRIFRIFKVARYVGELNSLVTAVKATRAKIAVFLFAILTATLIMGTAMYVVEGETNPGFSNIPKSIYWAIVTITTVGYGDISPQTTFGQVVAATAMVLGYSLIIIPAGIFSAELVQVGREPLSTQVCRACAREGHDSDAVYCKYCGSGLASPSAR